MNQIYLTKEKKILNKSQLHIIRQLLKIITNRKCKNLLDLDEKAQLAEIINIINQKKVKKLIQSDLIQNETKNLILQSNKQMYKRIKKYNDNDKSETENIMQHDDNDESETENKYLYKKFVFFYLKKLKIVKMLDDFIKYKDYDLALKDRELVYLDLKTSTKRFIKHLYFFWFPSLEINNLLALNLEDLNTWKIYVFLNIPEPIDDFKNTYYKFYKREHIVKIIIAEPWFFLKYLNRYSRHLIIYSKRLLCYYNVVVDSLQTYKYEVIELNLNQSPYKNTLLSKNLFWIFLDIKACLMHGYYNKSILSSLSQLHEISSDPQNIKKEILDQLLFNKSHINFILLSERIPFNYFWI